MGGELPHEGLGPLHHPGGPDEVGGALVQSGRLDVHDAAKAIGRLATGLLHQEGHGVALIEQAQLAVRGVGAGRVDVDGDDREFGKNRTLSFASSCNQFIVFSMDERKWRKLFDKQIGIL